MHTRPSNPKRATQQAEIEKEEPRALLSDEERALRSQAASILGKLGGRKGGLQRDANLTPERKKEIAQMGAAARWKTKD